MATKSDIGAGNTAVSNDRQARKALIRQKGYLDQEIFRGRPTSAIASSDAGRKLAARREKMQPRRQQPRPTGVSRPAAAPAQRNAIGGPVPVQAVSAD